MSFSNKKLTFPRIFESQGGSRRDTVGISVRRPPLIDASLRVTGAKARQLDVRVDRTRLNLSLPFFLTLARSLLDAIPGKLIGSHQVCGVNHRSLIPLLGKRSWQSYSETDRRRAKWSYKVLKLLMFFPVEVKNIIRIKTNNRTDPGGRRTVRGKGSRKLCFKYRYRHLSLSHIFRHFYFRTVMKRQSA